MKGGRAANAWAQGTALFTTDWVALCQGTESLRVQFSWSKRRHFDLFITNLLLRVPDFDTLSWSEFRNWPVSRKTFGIPAIDRKDEAWCGSIKCRMLDETHHAGHTRETKTWVSFTKSKAGTGNRDERKQRKIPSVLKIVPSSLQFSTSTLWNNLSNYRRRKGLPCGLLWAQIIGHGWYWASWNHIIDFLAPWIQVLHISNRRSWEESFGRLYKLPRERRSFVRQGKAASPSSSCFINEDVQGDKIMFHFLLLHDQAIIRRIILWQLQPLKQLMPEELMMALPCLETYHVRPTSESLYLSLSYTTCGHWESFHCDVKVIRKEGSKIGDCHPMVLPSRNVSSVFMPGYSLS